MRYSYVYLVKSEDDALEAFKAYKDEVENQKKKEKEKTKLYKHALLVARIALAECAVMCGGHVSTWHGVVSTLNTISIK